MKQNSEVALKKKPQTTGWFIIYKSITVWAVMDSKTLLEIAPLPLNPVLCRLS